MALHAEETTTKDHGHRSWTDGHLAWNIDSIPLNIAGYHMGGLLAAALVYDSSSQVLYGLPGIEKNKKAHPRTMRAGCTKIKKTQYVSMQVNAW
jgi:hypothetical protein